MVNDMEDSQPATPSAVPEDSGHRSHKDRMARALQRERARTGWSLSEAAKRAGVSKSTLSQLESGAGNPSVETMWALAAAYGVQLAQLLDPPRPQTTVTRFADLAQLPSSHASYTAALLSAGQAGVRRDVFLIRAEPGGVRESAPHPAGTVERLVVGSGAVRACCDGEQVELAPGDSMTYPGDAAHSVEALEPGTTLVYVVDS